MTMLRDFIDAQRLHCDRLTSIILHHAAQSEPVTIEGGNTADLADAEDMRSLLMEQGQEPSAAGLAEFIRFARMGEDEKDKAIEALVDLEAMRGILDGAGYSPTPTGLRVLLDLVARLDQSREEAEAARERLVYITSGDPAATLAELVSTVGEALADAQNAQDRLAGRDVSIVQAQKTIAAALGTSPLNRLDCLASDVTETMTALRRALGCPDGASAGQILAEVKISRAERDRLAGDLSILTAECARIGRAIAPLWTGDPADCIGKRVEAVAKAAHVRAETVDSLYDKLRERDAKIAALTPGPWVRLGDAAPNLADTVLMWSGLHGTPTWMQVFHGMAAQSVPADYLWRPLPAGLLDVPAPASTPNDKVTP